ncbi:MAG TPA: heme ABC exporter ATP-binding protein CcmA [Sphingomicrobium sp.]|nr:heme ABC exporter ATP-binding protein CcmA [Sphingomicrobium sp.]
MKPLLRFDSVTCRRGGRLLFEDVDLQLGPSEALQVTGPNGSGKSSLIRLAAGLLGPERGTIERAPLALADDSLALDRELALEDALRFWGGDVPAGLSALGLTALAEVPVRLLSAGQAKRSALARVAASGAALWLLDEPSNGLDSQSAGLLADCLDRHRAKGGAVLAASHSPLPGEWATVELGR